jgi:ketosteroid isomerase-like protein
MTDASEPTTKTSESKHPNAEVFEKVYETFTTGDMDSLSHLIAPDVVWHVPGSNLISGTYTNRDAIFGCFNKIYELSKGSYKPALLDILADDTYTVALLHATAKHGEKTLDQDYAFIARINDGQMTELQEAWSEGPAWNDFWS